MITQKFSCKVCESARVLCQCINHRDRCKLFILNSDLAVKLQN